jgi:hypothetical protein
LQLYKNYSCEKCVNSHHLERAGGITPSLTYATKLDCTSICLIIMAWSGFGEKR